MLNDDIFLRSFIVNAISDSKIYLFYHGKFNHEIKYMLHISIMHFLHSSLTFEIIIALFSFCL